MRIAAGGVMNVAVVVGGAVGGGCGGVVTAIGVVTVIRGEEGLVAAVSGDDTEEWIGGRGPDNNEPAAAEGDEADPGSDAVPNWDSMECIGECDGCACGESSCEC
jgi:hypothetical protein